MSKWFGGFVTGSLLLYSIIATSAVAKLAREAEENSKKEEEE